MKFKFHRDMTTGRYWLEFGTLAVGFTFPWQKFWGRPPEFRVFFRRKVIWPRLK